MKIEPGDETLAHVLRRNLPWRKATLTECGLAGASNKALSRQEFVERFKRLGGTRARLVSCQTCMGTFERYYGDDADHLMVREIRDAVERELTRTRSLDPQRHLVIHELQALGILANRHADEFREIVEDIQGTVSIRTQRKKGA